MATVTWSKDIAETYDAKSQAMFEPALIGPTIDLLTEFAGNGSALEFAIGTGRVGLALAARGTAVDGIDLSPHMVEQLQRKPGANAIAVTIGDMATTRLGKTFKLVYLVFNTIMNVTTQDEQVAVFESAAAHLKPGGHFLVEVVVPQLRQLPKGGLAHVFEMTPDRLGFVTFDDVEGQISWSNSWIKHRRAIDCVPRDVSVRVARRAGPDGPHFRPPSQAPLGRLDQGTVHQREREPDRGL